jgi:hypothetical protein
MDWLLDQMKQADAAQVSNLGQALAPAIVGQFEALTQLRYESVRFTVQLGTEGVVVAGAVRSPDRISVGTREQFSTLYRLALAEYLCTTVVLDDQLVQSDNTSKRQYADGLVPSTACRESPRLSDRCLHMPVRRLPRCRRDDCDPQKVSA